MATVDRDTASLNLRIPLPLKADLIAIADREYTSVSIVVRRLLRDATEHLTRHQPRARRPKAGDGPRGNADGLDRLVVNASRRDKRRPDCDA